MTRRRIIAALSMVGIVIVAAEITAQTQKRSKTDTYHRAARRTTDSGKQIE
jgi:hypothetical protein